MLPILTHGTFKGAVTVRGPTAMMAPASNTWVASQTLLENNDAKTTLQFASSGSNANLQPSRDNEIDGFFRLARREEAA